jgi:hypothetical protein
MTLPRHRDGCAAPAQGAKVRLKAEPPRRNWSTVHLPPSLRPDRLAWFRRPRYSTPGLLSRFGAPSPHERFKL